MDRRVVFPLPKGPTIATFFPFPDRDVNSTEHGNEFVPCLE
jgi:hypothetical protein